MANLYEIGNVSNKTLVQNALDRGLRLGFLDGETSPNIAAVYGNWGVNVTHKNILAGRRVTSIVLQNEKDLKLLKLEWEKPGAVTISADKSKKIHVKGLGDDSALLRTVRDEIDKYDIVVAQNGDRFDFPVLQHRMMLLGLPPMRNVITFDTLKASKRSFLPDGGHSLDAQSSELGYGNKDKQDMDDCILTMLGHPEVSKGRLNYNVKDVELLRKVFWRKLDYYNLNQAFINMLMLFLKETKPYCVKCAARRQKKFDVAKTMITFQTSGRREKRWQCKNCFHHWAIKLEDK